MRRRGLGRLRAERNDNSERVRVAAGKGGNPRETSLRPVRANLRETPRAEAVARERNDSSERAEADAGKGGNSRTASARPMRATCETPRAGAVMH